MSKTTKARHKRCPKCKGLTAHNLVPLSDGGILRTWYPIDWREQNRSWKERAPNQVVAGYVRYPEEGDCPLTGTHAVMPPRERRLDILRIDVGDELNYATYMLREMCTRGEMLQKEFMDEFHRVGAQAQAFKDSFGKFTHSWDKDEFHCINVVPVPPALDKDGNPRTKRVENYEFTVPTADEYQAIRSRELEFAQRYAGNGEAVADRMARWDVLNPPTVSQTVLRGYRREPIGSSRNSLVWIGPTADAVAAALDDRKLDRSFEALERRMLDERDDTTAKH